LVSAPTYAGIVAAQTRLPVHRIVRNTSLVVVSACSARGEGNSILIPSACLQTLVVVLVSAVCRFIVFVIDATKVLRCALKTSGE
jgi:hypothetical protein